MLEILKDKRFVDKLPEAIQAKISRFLSKYCKSCQKKHPFFSYIETRFSKELQEYYNEIARQDS